jgi:arsenite methyltransferase
MSSRLRHAGFQVDATKIIPVFNTAYDTNTFSNQLIDSIVSFVSGRNGLTRDEAEAWAGEIRLAGTRGEYFFSLNRYLFLAKKQ